MSAKPLWAPENPSDLHPKSVDPCPTAGVFVSKAEKVKEFLAELQGLQVINCMSFGCGAQYQRTTYQPIGCVYIFEDAHLPWNPFTKSSVYWWTGDYMTPKKAEKAASRFDCYVVDAYYPEDDSPDTKMLHFNTFESCATWVWVHRRQDTQENLHVYYVLTYTGETVTGAYRIFSKNPELHLAAYGGDTIFDELGHSLGSNQLVMPLEQVTEETLALAKKLAEEAA